MCVPACNSGPSASITGGPGAFNTAFTVSISSPVSYGVSSNTGAPASAPSNPFKSNRVVNNTRTPGNRSRAASLNSNPVDPPSNTASVTTKSKTRAPFASHTIASPTVAKSSTPQPRAIKAVARANRRLSFESTNKACMGAEKKTALSPPQRPERRVEGATNVEAGLSSSSSRGSATTA